jgi:hypothetical protein
VGEAAAQIGAGLLHALAGVLGGDRELAADLVVGEAVDAAQAEGDGEARRQVGERVAEGEPQLVAVDDAVGQGDRTLEGGGVVVVVAGGVDLVGAAAGGLEGCRGTGCGGGAGPTGGTSRRGRGACAGGSGRAGPRG